MVLPASNPTKSYWIEAAESPLRHHRSTENLPESVDVVIVGAGYAGAATAYWIHKFTAATAKQPQIAILEARDVCGCATGRNGGQLRPHLYSRYPAWAERFGPDGAMELIRHEMAHLAAFDQLAKEEGIVEETCLEFGETFDAAMTEEAWTRLKRALETMRADHGDDNDIVKSCRLIEDACEAQSFTQMKDCIGAVVHPAGQIWPYKFVHSILQILLDTGNLNLQAHTPVETISDVGDDGWIDVKTDRGSVRTRAVVHATNAFVSHLLPEFQKLIVPEISTLAAISAPSRFIKHTGAQHWDSTVNVGHPIPRNLKRNSLTEGRTTTSSFHRHTTPLYWVEVDNSWSIGLINASQAHAMMSKYSESLISSNLGQLQTLWVVLPQSLPSLQCPRIKVVIGLESKPRVPTHFRSLEQYQVEKDILLQQALLGMVRMPRILLSAAHIAPRILVLIGAEHKLPELTKTHPVLPKPFLATAERIQDLQSTDWLKKAAAYKQSCEESAAKSFCRDARSMPQWSN
ncbi:hypothetical protein D0865_02154 [Hortaea werneckii]|uniref:FAD dependent oxidoreductase domain-containing protein n=1 Tax=Hortaea werneckii TaxID=91943 RepID=A0A3M7D4N6_HORWE|nr:hypothetical protein D0865_02154 [Hortaea werneckii]